MKRIPIDVKDFTEKIECIVRSIEDNSKVGGEIKGGTVQDLANEFIRQYKKLRPYKKEWHLKKVKYMPMRKPNKTKLLSNSKGEK